MVSCTIFVQSAVKKLYNSLQASEQFDVTKRYLSSYALFIFCDSFKDPINQKVIDILMKQLATEYSGSYSDTEIRS